MTKTEPTEWEAPALKAAQDALGTLPDSFASPLTVLASPAWRGVEGDVWRASAGDRSVIVKRYHDDTSFLVNFPDVADAAISAGQTGAGPEVIASDDTNRILVMEDLAAPWRAGGLHDVRSATVRASVIAAKKAIQNGPGFSRTSNIFDEIESLHALCAGEGIKTHNDVDVFKSFFDEARARIASLGSDCAPCHRDGNTANLMVDDQGNVKLIDYDLSANCDPFEDVGCYLQEFFENDADARGGFEEWLGRFDEGLFQRAMIYGHADDMRWGLIASVFGAKSPRKSLEFTKYGAWRFMRLEARIKRSDAYNQIRMAA